MNTEGTSRSESRLAEKDKKADKYELAALGEAVGGKEPLTRFKEGAEEMPLLEFYSRARLVCSDLDNTEYDLMAGEITQSMRETAWENWGIVKPKKNDVLKGCWDDKIIARWPVIDQSGIDGGRVNLFEKAALELGIVLPRQNYISWLNNEGLLTDPPGNFDAFCRLVSLQAPEAAEGVDRQLTVAVAGVSTITFKEKAIKDLKQIDQERRRNKSPDAQYSHLSAAQEFLLKNVWMPDNLGDEGYFKKNYLNIKTSFEQIGIFSADDKQSLKSAEEAWEWAKKSRNLKEEEEPFHLISEEELRQRGDDHGERQPVSDLLPEDMPPVPEEKSETPDWFRKLQAATVVAPAVEEPESPAVPPFAEEPGGPTEEEFHDWQARREPSEEPPKTAEKPNLQILARELINERKRREELRNAGRIVNEREGEESIELDRKIPELEAVFEEKFGELDEQGFFQRVFYGKEDAASIGLSPEDKTKMDDLKNELVRFGIEACAEGEVNSSKVLKLRDEIYEKALKILGKYGKEKLMDKNEFLAEFEKLVNARNLDWLGGLTETQAKKTQVEPEAEEKGDDEPDWLRGIREEQKSVQAEPEKTEEPEPKPPAKIALTDFR